eukprot:comp63125_c0_seq1/m.47934 comp63125_c0_seq1/g.47934  ORF comp63125_c0_seq1/g.47934 comp63125_c0_seq1/m.47934 type:complete len:135 (+) comp63125_c0_seq1:166-570(+)
MPYANLESSHSYRSATKQNQNNKLIQTFPGKEAENKEGTRDETIKNGQEGKNKNKMKERENENKEAKNRKKRALHKRGPLRISVVINTKIGTTQNQNIGTHKDAFRAAYLTGNPMPVTHDTITPLQYGKERYPP